MIRRLKEKFDYSWVIIALSFMTVLIALGFCSSNRSIYVVAITNALGISRSAFSLSETFRFITTALINVFFGFLVNKFGIKRLVVTGIAMLICGCITYAYSPNVLGFYFGGCLFGVGFSWTSTTMVGCIVNRWCKKNRGTIMGAILASNGIGGAIAVQIVSPLIYEEGNPFGYRNAYLLISVILFVLAITALLFFRDKPSGETQDAMPEKKKRSRGEGWAGVDYSVAKTKPYFYAALICVFFTGFILQGISGVAAAHMKDVGIDNAYIATVLSVHSISLAVSKFLTGFVYDRRGLRFTMNMCNISAIVVMTALSLMSASAAGNALAILYSIASALALPLETIMLPIYASDLFGDKSFDKIMGIFVSFNLAGYAVGIPAINLCYDFCGSYVPAFIACGVVMLAVTIALQFIIKEAHKLRENN